MHVCVPQWVEGLSDFLLEDLFEVKALCFLLRHVRVFHVWDFMLSSSFNFDFSC